MAIKQVPASASHDLLIIERDESFNPKVREFIQRKGFGLRLVRNLEDALLIISDLVKPIIIVECGAKPGCQEYATQYLECTSIHKHPIIFLGKDIDGLKITLDEVFRAATTLRSPWSQTELHGAINYIAEIYGSDQPERTEAKARPKIEAFARERSDNYVKDEKLQEDEDYDSQGPTHALFSEHGSVANLYFQQLQTFDLLQQSLGGAEYPRLNAHKAVLNESLMPHEKGLQDIIKQLQADSGTWAAQHLNRVVFLVDRAVQPLRLPADLLNDTHAASQLFALSIGLKNKALLRKEYIGRGSLILRKELCSAIKDSAYQLSANHNARGAANIVAIVSRLIGREIEIEDTSETVIASCILLSDLTDRICFQSGNWNPRAAHTLLRRIKAGKIRDVHPAALCCVAKLLAEAIASVNPGYLVHKSVRENPELIQKARENADKQVANDESKISIDRLIPGMKLSQPLYAFDGKQILEEDLTLDQDLIWRLWQLSALRPLNSPVIIVRAKEEKETEQAPSVENSESTRSK